MNNLVRLDDYRPHRQGQAICGACVHEWQAVAPVAVTTLQCPTCKQMAGYFVDDLVPDEHFFVCECGEHRLYALVSGDLFCGSCATRFSPWTDSPA